MVKLVVVPQDMQPQEVPVRKSKIVIGRFNDCDIVLGGLATSRRNTLISKMLNNFYVEDLGSANGTWVNGKKIARKLLRDGDVIAIGPHQIRFMVESHQTSNSNAVSQSVVRIVNVAKSYALGKQEIVALKNVSLTIRAGEFLAIAGPSGSGKSTLLNLIGCIDTPTSGSVIIGDDVSKKTPDQLADLRAHAIGFIFQTFNLLPVLSAWENIEYPLLRRKEISKKDRRARVKYYLDVVGLSEYAQHRPNQLSGGQRQRVAIARALATRPVIILADEPTANLDHKTGESILQLMKQINRDEGTTFIFSTHDARVMEIADRVVQVSDGEIIPMGSEAVVNSP